MSETIIGFGCLVLGSLALAIAARRKDGIFDQISALVWALFSFLFIVFLYMVYVEVL